MTRPPLRRIAVLILALSADALMVRSAAASLASPGVVAVGQGVAIVENAGWLQIFSLQDGALQGTAKLPLPIYEVHFDGRRSEFWGESWKDGPVVWSWRPGKNFRIEKIPASWIYKAFALRNGERLLALTISTAVLDEDLHRSHIALAKWDGQTLRFTGLAPPYDDEQRQGRFVVLGAQGLFAGFVDPVTGRPVTPNLGPLGHENGFFVWQPSSDRWEMVDSDTRQILESRNNGRSWAVREVLTGEAEAGTFFALEADPYRAGTAYALMRVERGGGEEEEESEESRRLELWSSPSEGHGWRSIWRDTTEESEEEDLVGELLFDPEAVWIQRTLHSTNGEQSIRLTAIPHAGAPRELTLKLPPPKQPDSRGGLQNGGARHTPG